MDKLIKVGIVLFNEVEVLDFAGPFEVFSIATYKNNNEKFFQVSTIGETGEAITARNGLKVLPDYSFKNAPLFDLLIIPGGYGAEEIEIHNEKMIDWIKNKSKEVDIIASVCTGAFLLAKANLLEGKKATTHWMDINRLQREFKNVNVVKDMKYVDEGNIITSGGISSGISMSLYIIERLINTETALRTAKRMEYEVTR